MEIKYVYVKTRSQFGKQCIFDDSDPSVEENIFPNSQLMEDYIRMNPVDVGVQTSQQFAAYEVQTESIVTKESGMHHTEGGWPKEINACDEEAVSRYRRRIEKDDNWAPKMRKLMEPMERYILQNNAVNIYEQYFDDVIPPETVPPSVRTVNVYKDLQDVVRPITHLSWSSDNGKRLAAAYCAVDFPKVSNNICVYSYIWDIENPNKALMALKASHPSVTIEFNSRDPSMLISGLMSGQVCNWDIRSGISPVMTSQPQFSHKYPANCALWINSKTNSEFFSASIEGTINWWDIRMLQKPVESLIMDLVDPLQGDVMRATGVSALQYEMTMGTKFMAGLENGLVINATRKAKNTAEKIAIKLECHYGPIITIDRNPFSLKNFLTVGDWSTKIWAEDTREGNLISTRQHKSILTGGCWSASRCSVFYVINNEGIMEIFDILLGLKMPVTTTCLCEDSLQAIAPHVDGKLMAVGSDRGKIYLVESSEALTTHSSKDRAHMAAFFERCSRYEKAVDNRMKETRLAQRISCQESESSMPLSKAKSKDSPRIQSKDRKIDDKRKPERERKKMKQKKSKDIWALLGDSELAEVEHQYFKTIEEEKKKYADAAAARCETPDETVSTLLIKESSNKRGKRDDSKADVDGGRKRDSRKQRALKESTSKDNSERASKAKEIVIVKRKHDTMADVRGNVEKTIDGTRTTGRAEIMGERFMESKKTHERTSDDDKNDDNDRNNGEIFVAHHSKGKCRRGTIKKKLPRSQGKQIAEQNLCDDEICVPEICCRDQIGTPICSVDGRETISTIDNDEERKMTLLIEEMIAGSPKNIFPIQFEHLPRYTEQDKKTILRENYVPPLFLTKVLRDGKKEIQQIKNQGVNAPRPKDLEHYGKNPLVINRIDEIRDELEVIPEVLSTNSITAEKIESSSETLKSNKKVVASKMSGKKTNPDSGDCQPIVARFGSKEILGIVGTKLTLPKLPERTSVPKPNISSGKKKNYPRISAATVHK